MSRKRTIKIPAGVDDGSRIRFADFFVTINVRPHEIFQRDDDNIYVDVRIPLVVAISGGVIEIPTLNGKKKIRIKAEVQPGSVIRLSGLGMPRLERRGRGDFYIRIYIDIPSSLVTLQSGIPNRHSRLKAAQSTGMSIIKISFAISWQI